MPIANIDTGSEFVEGWFITQTLGEGAYGEVKLVTGKTNGEVVAMKVLDFSRFPDAETIVRKEISIHRKLNHPHIIRYYAHRREETVEYMFLEYASGGELFDRIEPEYGMKMSDAQKYFRQLLLGVEYLHSLGITHRDLKPENLLLDSKDNIKIIDFGMATWFRFKGEERKLDQRCGTVPYISPEVLTKNYLAQPAELWTCGIILVALIAGELPFDNATKDCSRYNNWLQGNITESPFTRISNLDLAFIRKILNPTPHLRLTLAQMKSHSWLTKDKVEDFYRQKGNSKGDAKGIKRVRSGSALTASSNGSKILSSYSQPEILDKEANNAQMPYINLTSFSQPEQPDNMLLSQPNGNQSQNNPLQKLVKRMTRFFVTTNIEETVKKLKELSTELHYVFKRNSVALVTFSISDCHHVQLIFKATLFDMQKRILVDFRLSKGDGLEFKRQFKKIRQCLQPIISPDTIEDDAINNSE